ncbi:LPS-assembly protein LptD [Neisseria sp. ZJ106]|uniref:LPS-assembly protein LptD n=1 Tax=Neisseria lisongii TaxID=2912188 RepID=A0ABY7RK43_9NEIS|nr:LPS-assembly protein LptD [Neisseria lisongii]MCF7522005.1 LPS-assembly protein LptD [Neisseria lisongii]WCL71151.1 LPS-assembly protein LptD [Neisseria lisongii]
MVRLFSLKPLVLALGVAFSAAAAAQSDVSVLPETETAARPEAAETAVGSKGSDTELSLGSTCLVCEPENLKPEAQPEIRRSGEDAPPEHTRITADHIEGQTGVEVKAQGDVIVERNQDILNAPQVHYNQAENTVTAGDTFTLYQNGSTVSGDIITYNLDTGNGTTQNVRLEAEHEGRRLQSVSKQAEISGHNRYKLIHTKFNTCAPGDAAWYIRAESVEADQESGIGVAKHAALVFGGVPVLYTPWADFPLNGNRKSGLLVPTIATGSDGLTLDVPYYFNLAPNLDATLTPSIVSARGVRLGGELRYLQPKYSGEVEGNWMPSDKRSEHDNRYRFKWQHRQQFAPHLSGGVDFNQVSDNDYYRDFYNRTNLTDYVNLNRQAWLGYNNTLWGGRFGSTVSVQKYQTLANELGYKDEPYAILPRLSGSWHKNIGNAEVNLFGQFTHFSHDSKQSAYRTVLHPSIKWDFHNQWGYLRPKIGVNATYYDLKRFGDQPSRNLSRTLPMFSLDSGMTFERNKRLFGSEYLQTLEPRLFYNYIPTKSQNDLPNFDSSENSFSYDQLFRENLYSGSDRINAANSLSAAVQSRLLNPITGAEILRAGIGQKFYLKNDNVLLDGSIGRNERNSSDWVAFAHGNLTDSVRLDTDIHYNRNQRRLEQYAVGLRYRPEAGKVLSLRYKYGHNERIYLQDNGRYLYDKLKQIDVAAQWPLSKNLYAVARYNYEITVKKPLEMLAGVEYKSGCGCWSASVVGHRYVTGENSRKNAVFFNLQLKDLSSIGKSPFEQLRLAVPGYSKPNEVMKP